MVVRGRPVVMGWRCMRVVVVVLLMVNFMGGVVLVVESARTLKDAIGERGGVAVITDEVSAESDGWSSEAGPVSEGGRFSGDGGGGGGGVGDDPVWDAEAESPPAQRQRDRSLWGMSKRLVPTGPNPLHN